MSDNRADVEKSATRAMDVARRHIGVRAEVREVT
jgi:hypothetical protein